MKIGIVTALVLAFLYLAAIPWTPLNILPAAVFLAVALGLRHGSAWSGYGGALFQAARWIGQVMAMGRLGATTVPWASVALATLLIAWLVYLLFRAGRALAGSAPGKSRWAWIALAAITIMSGQFYDAFVIPTGSMEDTLQIGDHLLVRVWGVSPSRGAILVFRYPPDMRQIQLKRCMGIPGDRIKMVDKQVYLNGKKLDEPYALHTTQYVDAYRDNFPSAANVQLLGAGKDMLNHHVMNGELVVPADSFFVMGDNRDASLDSRYWGFVPRANLIGAPWIVYWSYELPTQAMASSNIIDLAALAGRYRSFFSQTRWGRILMPVRGYALQ